MSITYVTDPVTGVTVAVDGNGKLITGQLPVFGGGGSTGIGGAAPKPTVTPKTQGGGGLIAPTITNIISTPPPLPISIFTSRLYTNLTVAFTNISIQAVRYKWFFGDGFIATDKNPIHYYQATGTYTVILRAYNATGAYQDSSASVVVTSVSANVNFTNTSSGLNAQFTETSTISSDTWTWNFGDGTTSNEQNPHHVFPALGPYSVKLTLANGQSVTKTVTISAVQPFVLDSTTTLTAGFATPIAIDATYIYCVKSDGTIQLRTIASPGSVFDSFACGSTSPRPAVDGTSVYAGHTVVKIDNKTSPYANTATISVADIANVQGIAVDASYIYVADASKGLHRFDVVTHAEDGTFAYASPAVGVALDANNAYILTNPSGGANVRIISKSTGLQVGYILDLNLSSLGNYPQSIAVDANYIYVVAKTTNYVYRYDVNTLALVDSFDPSFSPTGGQQTYIAVDVNHMYLCGGVGFSDATLKIFDFGVQNDLPAANFSMDVNSGTAPLTVNFTNLSTGNGNTYAWEFGDGATSTATNPSNTFDQAGTYIVRLTATNAIGSTVIEETVVVTDLASTPTTALSIAYFTADNYTGTNPLTVNFTDGTTPSPDSWEWSIGGIVFSTSQNPSHTFSADGSYVVQLKVTKGAWSSTFTRTIIIAAGSYPPIVTNFSADNQAGIAPLSVHFTIATSGSPTSYFWDFGDGFTSTDINPTHIYLVPGTYMATVTVTNANGSSSSSMEIVVAQVMIVSTIGNSFIGASKIGYYIVDTINNRVLIYASDGTFLQAFGSIGSGIGQFTHPTTLALLGGVQLLDRIETPPQ